MPLSADAELAQEASRATVVCCGQVTSRNAQQHDEGDSNDTIQHRR